MHQPNTLDEQVPDPLACKRNAPSGAARAIVLPPSFFVFVTSGLNTLASRAQAPQRGPMVPWGSAKPLSGASYSAMELSEDGSAVFVLDQRLLPTEQTYRTYTASAGGAEAIRDMVVRGAPAIGITAAYAMTLAAWEACGDDPRNYLARMRRTADLLLDTRPTAVNLQWAINQCMALAAEHAGDDPAPRHSAMAELARSIHRDDVESCRSMGRLGAERIEPGATVLTHCNAGALATGGYGTALGVVRAAAAAGKDIRVFASETRPYFQGARLTSWELHEDGIDVTVVSDNMVGHCMQQGMIDAVVVGADRIVANGDVANKIGTYGIACLAQRHGIPFYVAAPWSTFDLETETGAGIPIEQRGREELVRVGDRQLVADGIAVYNPAFDVTPAELVTAIFTERGAFEPAEVKNSS